MAARIIIESTYRGFGDPVWMRLKRVSIAEVVKCRIMAAKTGLMLSTETLAEHSLKGGDIVRVVLALIAANKTSKDMSWEQTAETDLAGRDVLKDVKNSICLNQKEEN